MVTWTPLPKDRRNFPTCVWKTMYPSPRRRSPCGSLAPFWPFWMAQRQSGQWSWCNLVMRWTLSSTATPCANELAHAPTNVSTWAFTGAPAAGELQRQWEMDLPLHWRPNRSSRTMTGLQSTWWKKTRPRRQPAAPKAAKGYGKMGKQCSFPRWQPYGKGKATPFKWRQLALGKSPVIGTSLGSLLRRASAPVALTPDRGKHPNTVALTSSDLQWGPWERSSSILHFSMEWAPLSWLWKLWSAPRLAIFHGRFAQTATRCWTIIFLMLVIVAISMPMTLRPWLRKFSSSTNMALQWCWYLPGHRALLSVSSSMALQERRAQKAASLSGMRNFWVGWKGCFVLVKSSFWLRMSWCKTLVTSGIFRMPCKPSLCFVTLQIFPSSIVRGCFGRGFDGAMWADAPLKNCKVWPGEASLPHHTSPYLSRQGSTKEDEANQPSCQVALAARSAPVRALALPWHCNVGRSHWHLAHTSDRSQGAASRFLPSFHWSGWCTLAGSSQDDGQLMEFSRGKVPDPFAADAVRCLGQPCRRSSANSSAVCAGACSQRANDSGQSSLDSSPLHQAAKFFNVGTLAGHCGDPTPPVWRLQHRTWHRPGVWQMASMGRRTPAQVGGGLWTATFGGWFFRKPFWMAAAASCSCFQGL